MSFEHEASVDGAGEGAEQSLEPVFLVEATRVRMSVAWAAVHRYVHAISNLRMGLC